MRDQRSDLAITFQILRHASGSSRVFAALRPRFAGLTPLTRPSGAPGLGNYVMARTINVRSGTGSKFDSTRREDITMQTTSITPSIGVTIGRHTRLYYAHIPTAPAVVDTPSTITLYAATLADVSGLAYGEIQFDTFRATSVARLVLVDSTELAWQRRRCREKKHLFVAADPILVGHHTLQQWLWQRLGAAETSSENRNLAHA
jgi:hypothetical protein